MATKDSQPHKWWQWLLLYPTLLSILLASIPTFIEIYKSINHEVPFGDVKRAEMSNKLWKNNVECTAAPIDYLTTQNNVKVDATICKSGDVFVRGLSPTNEGFFAWVSVEEVLAQQNEFSKASDTALMMPIRNSFADGFLSSNLEANQHTVVLCQRWIDNVRILRRVQVQNTGCFDQVVNTYTNYIESSQPVPPRCQDSCRVCGVKLNIDWGRKEVRYDGLFTGA
jgi:hypothetical protein